MDQTSHLTRRTALGLLAAGPALAASRRARAAEPVKVGLIITTSGPFASTGVMMSNAAKLFMANDAKQILGDIPVELVIRDDGGPNPDVAKRLVQELVTREKVQYLGGFQWTPTANAVAPLLSQAKIPCVLFNAAGVTLPRQSPWFVRTAFTQWQNNLPLGKWASGTRGWKRAYVLVTDFGPGVDADQAFTKGFTEGGGEIVGSVKVPIQSPNFVPFLLRAKEAKPDVIFGFHPGGTQTAAFIKAAAEAGLRDAGIQLLGPEDITSDEELPTMGPQALGTITAGPYSFAADRPANVRFKELWKAAYGFSPLRPNYVACGAWDGMHVICSAIAATGGKADAAGAIRAMSTFKAESPRGPISIDPVTRDIIQNIYIREVKMVDGEAQNVEFATIPNVKDPWKELNPA